MKNAVLLLAIAQICAATPLVKRWDDFVTKHAWDDAPKGWQNLGLAPATHKMDMRIGLKPSNFDSLVNDLFEVSDPAHARYGKHLSLEEVNALVRPQADTADLVDAWLAHHGVHSDSYKNAAGDWVTVTVPVAVAEKMLGTKYHVYNHTTTGETIVRTTSYSIPSALVGHVELVTPTTYFSTLRSMRSTAILQPWLDGENERSAGTAVSSAVPTSCNTRITPACLRALYTTSNYQPSASSGSQIGVVGYLNEYANNADLQTFFRSFRTDAVGATFKTVQVNGGGNDQSDPGVEANLDIQYTEGISYPLPNTYYSTGGSPPFTPDSQTTSNTNEPYLDWLNYINGQSSVPYTVTTSYGDDEQTVPKDYASKVCNGFAQLGARGVSLLFSSGDFGVGGGDCKSNDGTNKVKFQPAFPASCPYVTAVGGTTGTAPEKAVSFSGGGFSNYFGRPSYQSSAVSSYVSKLGSTYSTLYNASGRAYPDIAAQGSGFQVVVGGRTTSVGGTSASSPTVAGVIALLNDYRLRNGKQSLGFLNPFLYQTGYKGLNDITSGSNPGCQTNGFSSGTGWDPVTGLGTPDFTKLQSLV